MPGTLTVLAPVGGDVVALGDVPDPVFAGCLVGPGVAVLPDPTGEVQVGSPVTGVVSVVHPHAFVVEADGRSVLVHLGIDTTRLGGTGFRTLVVRGQAVGAGVPVVVWDTSAAVEASLSLLCPVVALEAPAGSVRPAAGPGGRVAGGDPLLRWD